jgi:hypothetical protein
MPGVADIEASRPRGSDAQQADTEEVDAFRILAEAEDAGQH